MKGCFMKCLREERCQSYQHPASRPSCLTRHKSNEYLKNKKPKGVIFKSLIHPKQIKASNYSRKIIFFTLNHSPNKAEQKK